MRITVDLPEDLIDEARRLAGAESKTATIILALKDFVDRKKTEKLRKLRGSVTVERDLTVFRRKR